MAMAMATASKLFYTLLILTILGREANTSGSCALSDIHVTQTVTGGSVLGKPEYKVEVSNWCSCPQTNVRLNCVGWSSVELPDPAIFKDDGNTCLINNGGPVVSGKAITFNYAWDETTPFSPASATPSCK